MLLEAFFFFDLLSSSTPTSTHILTYTKGVTQQSHEESMGIKPPLDHMDARGTHMDLREATLSGNF